jgi:hypothetical protein
MKFGPGNLLCVPIALLLNVTVCATEPAKPRLPSLKQIITSTLLALPTDMGTFTRLIPAGTLTKANPHEYTWSTNAFYTSEGYRMSIYATTNGPHGSLREANIVFFVMPCVSKASLLKTLPGSFRTLANMRDSFALQYGKVELIVGFERNARNQYCVSQIGRDSHPFPPQPPPPHDSMDHYLEHGIITH